MYFVSRLLQSISMFWSRLLSPFNSVLYQARRFNPFSGIRAAARWTGARFQSLLNWPSRYLGIKIPGLSNKQGEALNPRESLRDWWNSLPWRDPEKRRTRVSKRAQFSQIHLFNQWMNTRTVLHIGTVIGRSVADITLESSIRKPIYLQFSQIDPAEQGAPIQLIYVAGDSQLVVDGQSVEQYALIRNGSQITIGDEKYTCELYAWEKTPVMTRVDAGWATTVGPVRTNNEDAIGIYQHKEAYLFAIADGVGGGQDGDLLSAFAIQYLLAVFDKNVSFKLRWNSIFRQAFESINAEVRAFARRSPYPSGTTLTAVVIKNFEAHIAHVGDTRVYLYHKGTFQQITTDHSKRVEVELETRRAAESGEPPPMRDVLLKAIGKNDAIDPDIFTVPLQPGDKLLLCTDGLTDSVSLEDITRIIGTTRAEPAARLLIQLANEHETSDNVSAVVLDVMTDPYIEDIWQGRNSERVYVGYDHSWKLKLRKPTEPVTIYREQRQMGCAVILVGILLLGMTLWVLTNRGNQPSGTVSPPTETAEPTLSPTKLPSTLIPTQRVQPTRTPTPVFTPITVTVRPLPTATPTVQLMPTSTLRPPAS